MFTFEPMADFLSLAFLILETPISRGRQLFRNGDFGQWVVHQSAMSLLVDLEFDLRRRVENRDPLNKLPVHVQTK
jgi:hypothetical protein